MSIGNRLQKAHDKKAVEFAEASYAPNVDEYAICERCDCDFHTDDLSLSERDCQLPNQLLCIDCWDYRWD